MHNDFEPIHLKKSRQSLDKHLKTAQIHAHENEDYKKGILKEPSWWEKFLRLFKV